MKVLIAEDSTIAALAIKAQLLNLGYDVYVAKNGKQAYDIWEEVSPDIVITDINMPLMNGLELIQKIRESETDSYTFIIVVTAVNDTDSFADSFEIGADDYISKPIQLTELKSRLKVGERVVQLQEKQFVLYAIGQLVEARDDETGQHIERVVEYALLIAKELKKNPEYREIITRAFIDNLTLASAMHDIGKIGIKDSILQKPGKLDKDEYEIMKRHTEIGEQIIEKIQMKYPNIQFLKMAREVIRYHHERCDGKGYPEGLSNGDIPLSAKIVAVADVFDALISKRVYKEKYTLEEAFQIIQEGTGTQFDPVIVDALCAHKKYISNMLKSEEKKREEQNINNRRQ